MTGIQYFKNRDTLPIVILAALLITIVLMLLVRLPGMIDSEDKSITITGENGIYDLTGIAELEEKSAILLPGPLYYPSTLMTPETAKTDLPVSTEQFDALRADYLSQRFVVLVPDNSDVYTLTFNLSGRHAMRVYVNGKIVGQAGNPSATKQGTEVWENNLTCYASPKDGVMDIILQSAQYYHYRIGAQLAALSIQNTAFAAGGGLTVDMIGFFLMGAFVCAAVLLLFIYLLLSHTKATLFFALACLSMALRECIQSQAWTHLSFLSGNTSFMLEYMSVALLTIFLSLYLGQYIEKQFLHAAQYTAIAGSLAYAVCLLVCDSVFYTAILKYYQALLVLCIVPGIAGLIWTMRNPNREQRAAIFGIAVFFLAAVSDIMLYNNLFGYQHPRTPISEAAMLVFVVAQTVSLFLMNNRVLAEAKDAEEKLAAEKDSLETLNRMKTEFLGNVSHELKTPLTVMSGYAQTTGQLAERPGELDGGEVTRRMKLISSEAERLSLMVGQVLDVTRMEEGRMAMEKRSCHIDEIIHTAVETHYPMLNKNANRLEIHIDPGLPAVSADPARISQVIVNLISNAVRFTANGLITISVKRENKNIVVHVADNGTGIAPERFPYLFRRYYHKEKAGSGQNTGTGLGLYICKKIVEQHGGSIWIESKELAGTSVFFSLPLP
ncbi:histidine kinase,7TM-containing protein possibly involved in signal transduction,histidine kinase [Desulfosporosinus orientis DSM 765]|uniref:histidine kinase n=1 Tax=Desulfosporosinus orientis (strain ATCC 19365 / DSM 765 / NCIMB 8382 / VKM B-1628 / Singapore I) TaxID=768706 RepID=G7WBA0_DESOD|nr:histidine kinase,7TM-containing protein possibly involved in signal transduction,histidine kinase [Desulfosporosinus orientis DSM 765]